MICLFLKNTQQPDMHNLKTDARTSGRRNLLLDLQK